NTGTATIAAGGSDIAESVFAGGVLNVSGVATATILSGGGSLVIAAGGTALGILAAEPAGPTVPEGADGFVAVTVEAGGLLSGATLHDKAGGLVSAGGTAL